MNLRIEMNLDNEAFQGHSARASIVISIGQALAKMNWPQVKALPDGEVDKITIMDINGNRVGHLLISP